VPDANAAEAAVVDGVDVRAAASLRDVVEFLAGRRELGRARAAPGELPGEAPTDLAEVRGQAAAKRALEIAAAGGHNALFMGPPGGGKTMLARTMPGLLPPMTFEEAVEATSVHSIAGLLRPGVSLLEHRPFRAPHHTASTVGLVGGGDPPRPGEIALAHHGVLFLDELPEFPRDALEGLREPLEEGAVTIVRARNRTTFPARFTLVAAMNPCPCGYHGDASDRCTCSDERVKRYRARLSGPLLDRIDLFVALPPVRVAELGEPTEGPGSREVRARVTSARERQRQRAANCAEPNARLPPRALREVAPLDADARALLTTAAERLGLSARAATRVLRVARTIADLEDEPRVSTTHLGEALGYRVPG
jgi:magnesium chelatase family protein